MKPEIPWYDHAVFYQIYPLSFRDSNTDGYGDLEGIISKIDYLEWLGITAVWLSPVSVSAMKDFGYDVSDYCDIDPRFGSLETFDRMVRALHAKNIKIIFDLVANHTSTEHPWFIEARSSIHSPKRDWYIWKDPTEGGGPPNNWRNISLGDSAWTLDEKTGQYYFHQFLPDQPDLNWRNPEVREAMKQVMEFWIARGVDGFRIDALSHIIEDNEFKNEPVTVSKELGYTDISYGGLDHVHTRDQPELKDIVKFFSEIAYAHRDTFIITEVYYSPEKLATLYRQSPHLNEVPFNFNLVYLPWKAAEYRSTIDACEKLLRPEDVRIYVLGNHDIPRLASRIGTDRIRLAALLLLTLPGSPFIYYGEEIGMVNAAVPISEAKDAFTPTAGFTRDQSRTPMQWDDSEYGGFSSVKPWLPVDPSKRLINVRVGQADSYSLLNLYRKLIETRKIFPVLTHGKYESFDAGSEDVFAYRRFDGTDTFLVYLNFSNKKHLIILKNDPELIVSTEYEERNVRIGPEYELSPNEGILVMEH